MPSQPYDGRLRPLLPGERNTSSWPRTAVCRVQALASPTSIFFAGAYLGMAFSDARSPRRSSCRRSRASRKEASGERRTHHRLFLLLSLLGVPLAVSMGLSAVTYIVIAGIPLATICPSHGERHHSFPLLAVVLFIYVGALLNATGMTQRLYAAARVAVGRVRGRASHNVGVLFRTRPVGISGSALADIGALGNVQITAMKEQGYAVRISRRASRPPGATLGPIFPPSIPLILYAARPPRFRGLKLLIAGILPSLVNCRICLIVTPDLVLPGQYNFPKIRG